MHQDNGLNREIYEGVFSRTRIQGPEPGVLHLYKSWDLEDLDQMGLQLPWEPPEDVDRQPTEE